MQALGDKYWNCQNVTCSILLDCGVTTFCHVQSQALEKAYGLGMAACQRACVCVCVCVVLVSPKMFFPHSCTILLLDEDLEVNKSQMPSFLKKKKIILTGKN